MKRTQKVADLNQVEAIQNFVRDMSTFVSEVDLVRDRYIINAKSIMGIFSLDLSRPITVELHSDDIEEIRRFDSIMEKYR